MSKKRIMSFPNDKFLDIFPDAEGMSIDETLEYLKEKTEEVRAQLQLSDNATSKLREELSKKERINTFLSVLLVLNLVFFWVVKYV